MPTAEWLLASACPGVHIPYWRSLCEELNCDLCSAASGQGTFPLQLVRRAAGDRQSAPRRSETPTTGWYNHSEITTAARVLQVCKSAPSMNWPLDARKPNKSGVEGTFDS